MKPVLSFLFTGEYICLLENNGETLLGLIALFIANMLDSTPVLFIVSEDSEELIKCYKSLWRKEGLSPVM